LGDINHSSPKVLEPPASGHDTQMGTGYAAFRESLENRQKVVFAGANDGMLHCFDAETMNELWAFIPNNLLYKLKKIRVISAEVPNCGYYMTHHFFVDGTSAIQDVYFGASWHTVLVCGQGAGWGKNHKCYYFALDVTDPLNPVPLWEFTDTYMGETWSVPKVVKVESLNKWVVFFGSGYDNDGDPGDVIGHYFYCVDVEDGELLGSWEIKETPEPTSPFGIQNTLPGSPETADLNNDGYADFVYFGDLKGRMWKIDLGDAIGHWDPTVIYQDPYYHPIFTKPAVYINTADNTIHLYFGTGGDENAPNTAQYSFVALVDGTSPSVEWFIGPDDLADELGINLDRKKGEFVVGERVWADPVIADRLVYIATLEGSIESLNPCKTLSGSGKIYARYILGNQVGGTALLTNEGAPLAFKLTKQKVRSAVTIGETEAISESGQQEIYKRKVFIQSYTQPAGGIGPEPPSQVLAQPVPQTSLVIRSWREVYKVDRIRN
jgi:outer membrane protein assembly factor BamB